MNHIIKFVAFTALIGLTSIVMYAFLWSWSDETKQYDGFKITDHRKRYALDIGNSGYGRFIDETLCLDKNPVCFRAETVWADYPDSFPKARWITICDPAIKRWRFFNRDSALELNCSNCDAEALRCPKIPESGGSWFADGNVSSELVGYPLLNQSRLRTYSYSLDGVLMKEITTIGVAFSSGYIAARNSFRNGSAYAWIQCDDLKCVLHWVNFETGSWLFQETPCNAGNEITFEIVGERPQMRLRQGAKDAEICRNSRGEPAYPFEFGKNIP
jgi:hypothetical protein